MYNVPKFKIDWGVQKIKKYFLEFSSAFDNSKIPPRDMHDMGNRFWLITSWDICQKIFRAKHTVILNTSNYCKYCHQKKRYGRVYIKNMYYLEIKAPCEFEDFSALSGLKIYNKVMWKRQSATPLYFWVQIANNIATFNKSVKKTAKFGPHNFTLVLIVCQYITSANAYALQCTNVPQYWY